MPHSFGKRARTRQMFAKKFRQHGNVNLTQYLMSMKVGDYVDIFANPTYHKGMPYKHYHGRTGIVFNITKASVGVRVNKEVNGRVLEKRIHVRIEHVRKSTCQREIIERKVSNDEYKAKVIAGTAERVSLKRQPGGMPKDAYFLAAPGDAELTTIQPLPFSDLL